MTSVTNKDILQEFAMWGELFNLRKKYYVPGSGQDALNLVSEADVIYKKYKDIGNELCHELIWSILHEYERKSVEGRTQ